MTSIKKSSATAEIPQYLATKAKEARLCANHSRKTAALMTGVPEGTIRQFEDTGKISLRQFIAITHAYGDMQQLEKLFVEPTTQINDIQNSAKKRQRGRL